MILLVMYNLTKKEQMDYTKFYEGIKNIGAWCHYFDSMWLIDTKASFDDEGLKIIRNNLRLHLDPDDNILIVEIKVGCLLSGYLPTEAWKWLQEHFSKDVKYGDGI